MAGTPFPQVALEELERPAGLALDRADRDAEDAGGLLL